MENKIGKIIITKQVSDIIDTLHNKIGAKEWSGVLFYTLKSGKIQNHYFIFNNDWIMCHMTTGGIAFPICL